MPLDDPPADGEAHPGAWVLLLRVETAEHIVKPIDFVAFVQASRSIGEYWFHTSVLPRSQEGTP